MRKCFRDLWRKPLPDLLSLTVAASVTIALISQGLPSRERKVSERSAFPKTLKPHAPVMHFDAVFDANLYL